MADERPNYETLLDYLLYAPVGAAIVLVEQLPRLAERGRERVEKRGALARLVGRFAASEARRRVGTPWSDQAREESVPPGETSRLTSDAHDDAVATRPPASPSRSAEVDDHDWQTRASTHQATGRARPRQSSGQPEQVTGRGLPIPGYDTLAASQVVERLASLTPAELEAVRRHESATRRRRTVLHKIAQLDSQRDNGTA